MLLPPSIRIVLVATMMLGVCSETGWCADRKGTMDQDCCGTSFHLGVLHEQRKNGIPEREMIVYLHRGCPDHLRLEYWVSPDWLTVAGRLCEPGSKQCEAATAAKIRLDFVSKNGKRARGSYSVDFPSAGHEEGKFTVKEHHEGPLYICE